MFLYSLALNVLVAVTLMTSENSLKLLLNCSGQRHSSELTICYFRWDTEMTFFKCFFSSLIYSKQSFKGKIKADEMSSGGDQSHSEDDVTF